MLRIRVLDNGDVFEGETWEELIDAMRLSMRLGPDPDISTYMEGIQRRVKIWNGSNIRTNDYKVFVEDLVSAGLVELLVGDE